MAWFSKNPEAGTPQIEDIEQLADKEKELTNNLASAIESVGSRTLAYEKQGLSRSEIHDKLVDERLLFEKALDDVEKWEASF